MDAFHCSRSCATHQPSNSFVDVQRVPWLLSLFLFCVSPPSPWRVFALFVFVRVFFFVPLVFSPSPFPLCRSLSVYSMSILFPIDINDTSSQPRFLSAPLSSAKFLKISRTIFQASTKNLTHVFCSALFRAAQHKSVPTPAKLK